MKVHPLAWAGLVLLFSAVIGLQMLQAKEPPPSLPPGVSANMLYVRSPAFIRRAALSYDALLADIYWIRAVQHYGRTKLSADANKQYDMLYPLLDLTTSLDPYFDVAYKFGSVFLAEKLPLGASRPDQAIAILEKGLRAQPDKWELAHELGFVYYWWLLDYSNASKWFTVASNMPNAPNWMRPLAAVVLAQGGNRTSSRELWNEIARDADAQWLRDQAKLRLTQLDAMDGIEVMEGLVRTYHDRTGAFPSSWDEMVRNGFLRAIPEDPSGKPFHLDAATGKVTLDPRSALNPLPDADHRL